VVFRSECPSNRIVRKGSLTCTLLRTALGVEGDTVLSALISAGSSFEVPVATTRAEARPGVEWFIFVAGIYPLFTSIPQHDQSAYGDQMMLAVYFVLGVILLLAVKTPQATAVRLHSLAGERLFTTR
jgi:hypothetical protein